MANLGMTSRLRATVAEEIRVAMVRRRMTGTQLAAAIGRSEAYVSRRLSGKTAFDTDDLEWIANTLGVEVTDFFPRGINARSFKPTKRGMRTQLHRRPQTGTARAASPVPPTHRRPALVVRHRTQAVT